MTSPTTPNSEPLISVRHATKQYPGVLALDDVDFDILPGEIHALVGENGAGKSTLMKILGGIVEPDAGTVTGPGGKPLTLAGPRDAQANGIGLIHQELNLVPDLTVAQNIFLGREIKRGPFQDDRAMNNAAGELLARLGVDIDPTVRVGSLPLAHAQLVEIATALSLDARVLIMDEPTAALGEADTEHLFGIIREFLTDTTAVVFISHRLNEVCEIADRVSVMRDGKMVWSGTEFTRENLISEMVGRAVDLSARPETKPGNDVVLEARNVSAGIAHNVSFTVRRGEIFGLAGLEGAGRTELARAIGGADPSTGTVAVHGTEADVSSPEAAVKSGIGFMSEDRKKYGLLLDQSVQANIALPSLSRDAKAGFINDSAHREVAESYRESLHIKIPSVEETAGNLSGGNQQKVVIAKWLARDLDILLVDEPTRGVDVGAKEEIYDLLEQLVADGTAIVVVSSELAELQRLCHRIGVMCEGELTGILENEDATQERIMELATVGGTALSAPAPTTSDKDAK